MQRLILDQITHLTAWGNASQIHYNDGRVVTSLYSLHKHEAQLLNFIRVHRSTLVNPEYIDGKPIIEHRKQGGLPRISLRLLSGQIIPVASTRLHRTLRALGALLMILLLRYTV